MPNTAYSAAMFAVRGFTEALIEDLRSNAPQVRVAVVMPGHVGTDIIGNTLRAHGKDPDPMLIDISNDFRDKAPLSAAQAATIILDGVRSGAWRILVGQDAAMIDERIRANPEAAYDYAELFRGLVPS
jgi:NAD(P)-dependent dehydrogenase (short-subunit alcohol dehydrogenase family)